MKHKLISFVIAETNRQKKGEPLESKAVRNAPRYYETAVPKKFKIGEEKREIADREITFVISSFSDNIILVETETPVSDIHSDATFNLRKLLLATAAEIAKKRGGKSDFAEEYSIGVVSDYKNDPESFYKPAEVVSFLRGEKYELAEKEIAYTMASSIKYAKDDLVVIDWDGAFIFEPEGEISSIVDLLQIANLQLLRNRVLDSELDERIKKTSRFAKMAASTAKTLFRKQELAEAFQSVIEARSKSVSDFESIDRDIKLIGDWYSARLYDLVSKKLKLEEWQKNIREKLDSLEDMYDIISENFSVSRIRRLELIQIVLFFILQAGWFTLIILEFLYFTR